MGYIPGFNAQWYIDIVIPWDSYRSVGQWFFLHGTSANDGKVEQDFCNELWFNVIIHSALLILHGMSHHSIADYNY